MFRSDIAKVWMFVVASILGAALITPWVHDIGLALGRYTEHQSSGWNALDYLGEKARKHPYENFFKRSLTFVAILLLIPLIKSLKNPKNQKHALRHDPQFLSHLFFGFFLAGGLLLCLGLLALQMGWYLWEDDVISWGKVIRKAAIPAISASLVEELIFRGALFAVFIRSARTEWRAILGLSAFFAILHLIQPPENALKDASQVNAWTGFWLVGQIGLNWLNPKIFIAEIATYFMVGLILARARLRTGSLWLPFSMHAGWVFALFLFKSITDKGHDIPDWLLGGTLKEGVAPLITLCLTWWAMEAFLNRHLNKHLTHLP